MKKIKRIIYVLLFGLIFLSGCGKGDVIAITVQNLDGKTFELGEKIDFASAFITKVYENGDKENIAITSNNIDMADLLNAYSSIGEKKINIYYCIEDETFSTEVTIYIVEKSYKTICKDELMKYNALVEYGKEAKDKVDAIKLIYSNYISNSSREQEAYELLDCAKKEIDNVYTLVEEENIYKLQEMTLKLQDLEKKLNSLLNYEDSTIKDEIELLKENINEVKNNLLDEVLYEKVNSLEVSLSGLISIVDNLESNVSENDQKITALTELLNTVLSQFVSKEELKNTISTLTKDYQDAITNAFNNQKFIVELRVNEGYIEYRYNNTNYFEKLVAVDIQSLESIDTTAGEVVVKLRNGQIIKTGQKIIVEDIDTNSINEELISTRKNQVVEIIKSYFTIKYDVNNYDCSYTLDALNNYYLGFVDYVELTGYNELEKAINLHLELKAYLDNFILEESDVEYLYSLENEFLLLDTNIDVCKAYFATLLNDADIAEYEKEAFKNRILTTNSIENIISLYEEALN